MAAVAAAAVICACATAQIVRLDTFAGVQAGDPLLAIFGPDQSLFNRQLQNGKYDPAIERALNDSAAGQLYGRVTPERSVIVYQCAANPDWCKPFGVGAVLGQVAAFAGADKDALARQWFKAEYAVDPVIDARVSRPQKLADLARPFELLAITNRLDLAHYDPKTDSWSGAEIRFTFGLTSTLVDRATLIVEFVLEDSKGDDFRKLAGRWADLSKFTDKVYAAELVKALNASGFSFPDPKPQAAAPRLKSLRTRMNRNEGGTWLLTQLNFKRSAKAFVAATLEDQPPKPQYSGPVPRAVWAGVEAHPQNYRFPGPLAKGSVSYLVVPEPQAVQPPQEMCDASEVTRSAVALKQCVWCHKTETGTNFRHIRPAENDAPVTLSTFLAGSHPGDVKSLRPPLIALYYGGIAIAPDGTYSNVAAKVDVSYARPGCSPSPKLAEPRRFHEVARRTLFLALAASGAKIGERAINSRFVMSESISTGRAAQPAAASLSSAFVE